MNIRIKRFLSGLLIYLYSLCIFDVLCVSKADELQEAFDGKRDFYGITVTRIIGGAIPGEPLFLDEAELIFACIKLMQGHDKISVKTSLQANLVKIKDQYKLQFNELYKRVNKATALTTWINTEPVFIRTFIDFMANKVPNFLDKANIVQLGIDIPTAIETIFNTREADILLAFDAISYTVNSSIKVKDSWKLCIFNEMFFSRTIPVSAKFRQNILNKALELSDHNTLLHINFLYDESRHDEFKKADYDRIKLALLSNNRFSSDATILNGTQYEMILNSLINKKDQSYLLNESNILWNKNVICYYKKASYCRESDSLLKQNFIYDVGDGVDHEEPSLTVDIPDGILDISYIVRKNLSTEICYDLPCQTRVRNTWSNVATHTSKLHVITSNWVSLYDNFAHLPTNSLIIHVDPILLNENVFSLRKGAVPAINPVFQLTGSGAFGSSLGGWQSIYDERLKASLDVSKLVKNNHISAIRLQFNNKIYILGLYDLKDAIAKAQRGY